MERTLRVSRLYSTGQYQNITIEDEISGIPDELAFDEEFIKALSQYQLLRTEARFIQYTKVREITKSESTLEGAFALIEDEIKDLYSNLFNIQQEGE